MWACNSVPAPLTPAKLRHHFCCCCCCLVYLYLPWWPCQVIFFHSFYFLAFISSRHEIYNAIQGRNEPKKREKKKCRTTKSMRMGRPVRLSYIYQNKKKTENIYRCALCVSCADTEMRWALRHALNQYMIDIYIDDWFIHISHGHVSCTAVDCCIWIRSCFHIYITIEWTKKKNVENIIEMMVFSFQEFLESVIFLCVCR